MFLIFIFSPKSISGSYMGIKAWEGLGSCFTLMKVFDSLKGRRDCDILEYFASTDRTQLKINFNNVSTICTQVTIQSHSKYWE